MTVFSAADSYLDLRQTTDPDGIVAFRLPAGNYKFRADYQGNRYWAAAGLSADTLHDVALETGGGAFALSVDTGSGPLKDARVYVFSAAGAYLGFYGVTDANGQVAERYVYTPYGGADYRGGSWETCGGATQHAWTYLFQGPAYARCFS